MHTNKMSRPEKERPPEEHRNDYNQRTGGASSNMSKLNRSSAAVKARNSSDKTQKKTDQMSEVSDSGWHTGWTGEEMWDTMVDTLKDRISDRDYRELKKAQFISRSALDETMEVWLPREPKSELIELLRDAAQENAFEITQMHFKWRTTEITKTNEEQPESAETLSIVRGVDVEPVSPTFFVHPYLPDGSLSILFGDPGTSKSLVALWMLAQISRGREIFGSETKPADVMMLSNEDPTGVSLGRFLNSGGDRKRIDLENFTGETFALEESQKLKATLAKHRPKVVVIDSVMSHVGGKADVYRPNEVSALLSPLQAMAQEFNIVIIGLMHMNKQDAGKAIYRIGGSISFAGIARSAMYLDVKPDEPSMRVMCHVKANYSAHGPAQEIEVLNGPGGIANVRWAGQSQLTADDLLKKPDGEESGKKLSEAEDLLRDLLMEGPRLSAEIYAEAEKREIKSRTLERAKKTLKVKSVKSKSSGKFNWELNEQKKR